MSAGCHYCNTIHPNEHICDKQKISTLRAQLAEARKREIDASRKLIDVQIERDTAIAEAKRMRRYVQHSDLCDKVLLPTENVICNCGLDAALSAPTEKKGEGA